MELFKWTDIKPYEMSLQGFRKTVQTHVLGLGGSRWKNKGCGSIMEHLSANSTEACKVNNSGRDRLLIFLEKNEKYLLYHWLWGL